MKKTSYTNTEHPSFFFRLRVLLLFIPFGFLSVTQSFSQKFNFITYNIDDGLPQSTVYEIFQDRDGMLWLGTDGGGLCRYDGFRFKTYGKKNGLSGNVVKKIAQDRQNTLWISTNNGLYYIKNDSIALLKELPNNSSIFFNSVFIDSKQNIWAATAGKGIFKITPTTDGKYRVKNYTSSDGLSGDHIFDVSEDKKGMIWIPSFGNGFDIYNPTSDSFKNIKLETKELNEIISIKEWNANHMAFGTKSSGAYIINSDVSKITYSVIPGTEGSQVWSIATDGPGNYWAATNNTGVICSNPDFKLDVSVGLQTNTIFKILVDREKNIWIGTDVGIAQYSGNRFTHITDSELPGLTETSAIIQDLQKEYWIGTSSGIYNVSYNNNRAKLLKHLTSAGGLPSNAITGICLAKDNTFWISTKNGISNYNGKIFKNYSEAEGLISTNAVCIFADSKNRVWIGSSEGLSLLNEERKFSNMSESNGLLNNEVSCIIEGRNGDVWIGTFGGLMKFAENKMFSFTEADGLSDKKINSICEDKTGNIYIGTFGSGIYKYNPNLSGKKIQLLCAESKLISGNINSLIFQNDSVLIAGTNLGLNKIIFDADYRIKSIKFLGRSDGFKNLENSFNAALVDNRGDLWFGTTKGLTLYHPKDDKVNAVKPTFRITRLEINGSECLFRDELKLSYNQNSLKASFVSISITNPSGNTYYSKLLGLDTAWNKLLIDKEDLDNFAFAEYKNLQPGKYELLLKSKNNDGVESDVSTLKFVIAQPFYKTRWFIFGSIAVFILLVYFFFKYRERKLILEKEKLESIVTERTAEVVASKKEIEAQKDLLEIQKHEITDSINYSKRIQNAILPEQKLLFENFKDSFILYQPKDIVSGDFYFFAEGKNGGFYLGVADCTGHGVPGAFMSMVGSKEISEALKTNVQPADILSALNIGIRKTLKQNNLEIGIKDGMDIGFLLVGKLENGSLKISYAGANRPLWVLKKNEKEILEIKATKTAIGGYTLDDQVFAQHELVIEKGDAVYLFSDGYADQFGGNSGKKMMTKRFKELLAENSHLPMKEQGTRLSDYFESWRGNTNEQVDDVLIIGIRA